MQVDLRKLRQRCKMTKPPGVQVKPGLWYTDNKADILAVAHLDCIPRTKHFGVVRIIPGNYYIVYNGQLDDRLGVYTILDLLPALGVKYDILLTTEEEKCNSTARLFQADKVYKWIFSFDRAGRDVALYQYLNDATVQAVKSVNMQAAHGSYSDVVELEHLECSAFNWGTGLVDGHYPTAHFSTRDYMSCVMSFLEFYNLYSAQRFAHEQQFWPAHENIIDLCDYCNQVSVLTEYDGFLICEDCEGHVRESWLDECAHCGNITTVEYLASHDAFLCAECAKQIIEWGV